MSYLTSVQLVSILETIKRRRSVGQMTSEQPTREQIEQLLEAATYAPNHHVSEPWQFFVLTGEARDALGKVMATSLKAQMQDISSERAQRQILKESAKPLRSPVIITVSVSHVEPQEEFLERIEAAAAAVQNMLLTAHEMGLCTCWRTGDAAYDPAVKQWFGLAPNDHIVGFIYLGYPCVSRPERVPTHFSAKTTWLS